MVKFRFKLAYTERSCSYEIPGTWTVEYAFMTIRKDIISDFDVGNSFHFVCVDNIRHRYQGQLEEYYEVDHSEVLHKTLNEVYGTLDVNTFYIRILEDVSNSGNATIARID